MRKRALAKFLLEFINQPFGLGGHSELFRPALFFL
jgi:hypothetical protein